MLKKLFLYAAVLWTGFILFLCLVKSSNLPLVNISNFDKFVHASMHFVFTTLWFLYFRKSLIDLSNFRLLIYSLLSSLLFGIAIELMQQYFTTTRSADLFDVLANLTGATLAVITIIGLNKISRIVDRI